MKISILFLYLRMTPERAHKIAIYVLMGLIGTHELAALIVSRYFPPDLLNAVNANICIGCDLSMQTDRGVLD